jgi:hypothetical protein
MEPGPRFSDMVNFSLERGGHRAIHDFRSELGLPGAVAVAGSRIVRPVVENPGTALATAAITAAVITGGIVVGRILRQQRSASAHRATSTSPNRAGVAAPPTMTPAATKQWASSL